MKDRRLRSPRPRRASSGGATPAARRSRPGTAEAAGLRWMSEALRAARDAARRGEIPVGAVLVGPDGRRLSSGSNRTLRDTDPTAHAEIVALRRAARRLGNHRLAGATLFCTLEPCSMCLGAMVQARIHGLVYGAVDAKGGGISRGRLDWSGANHRFSILGGVLAEPSADLLREFFRSRRR